MRRFSVIAPILLFVALAGCASTDSAGKKPSAGDDAQDAAAAEGADKKAPEPTSEVRAAAGKEAGETAKKKEKEAADKEKKEKEEAEKKWEKAVEDLETVEGLFKVHHSDEKLLLELSDKDFGKEFLYFGALDRGIGGSGGIYRGAMLWDNALVLHFEKRNDKKIVLVSNNTRYLEPGDALEKKMLDEITSEAILTAFDKVAENKDDSRYLIDLGGFFNGDNMQLARGMGSKYGVAKDLCLFPSVQAFPKNLEIGQELVVRSSTGSGGNMTMADPRSVTLRVHHSLCALPPDGFKSREMDQRVGYFLTERRDAMDMESKDPVKRFAERWRLQKKDPSADVSDPVEPIVYWVENSTPKKWRDAVKEGIQMWEPAFRKAGFSNGIVAKQMPEDADWSPGDVRYAVVRWSADENLGFAIGPSRTDPRTGEIFDADITMQASFITTYKRRFETYIQDLASMSKEEIQAQMDKIIMPQVPEDPEAAIRMCQMGGDEFLDQVAAAQAVASMLNPDFDSDEFIHAMLREVVAHEVGHTLGMRHNFKSSTWHSLADVNDVALTSKVGMVGSVMDYNPVNLAGPGETQGEFFPSVLGAYDMWNIEWGYSETNSDTALKALASRSNEPGLNYGTDEDSWFGDAFSTTWDMSDDPVAFSKAQISLAEKGLGKLMEKGAEDGEAYFEYSRWYGMFVSLYNRYHMSLGRFIGGYTLNRDLVGQGGGRPPIVPIDPDMQREALDTMIEKGLKWTGGVPDEEHLVMANKKYGSWGSWIDFWSFDPIPRVVNSVRYFALYGLTNTAMFERLGSQNRFDIPNALTPMEVANRVFQTVWPDEPDEHDRWSQSDYVMLLMQNLRMDTSPDVTALMDAMLRRAENRCKEYASSGNPQVAAHGQWLADKIERYRERQMAEIF